MKNEDGFYCSESMDFDKFVEDVEKFKDDDPLEEFKKFCKLYGFEEHKEIKDFIEREETEKIERTLKDIGRI